MTETVRNFYTATRVYKPRFLMVYDSIFVLLQICC